MRPRIGARSALCLAFLFAAPALAHEPDEKPESAEPDTAPVLIERVEPSYPEAARLAGIGGTVGLELSIGADGSVGEVKLIRSAGVGLDDAAIAAARKFRFRPAQHDGRPIASTVLFDQRFNIRPHLSAEIAAEPAPTEVAPAPALPENAGTERKSAYETTVVSRGPSSAASASSIRNLDFELRPKTAPNDLLRVVPGLLAVQHQGGGKADQLFLRGFDADHGTDVGVFVDGIPINLPSHAHGQGFADLHWLIPEAIERIDVVKGPYDVRFGDFSTAGAVNLITRERFESSSVSYTLGMFPSLGAGKAAATGRFVGIAAPELPGWAAKLHPWVAFEAAYDDGPFDHPERLKRYNLFSKISYDLSPRSQLGVFVQAYGSGWTGSGQIPAREVSAGRLSQFGSEDPSEGGVTERQMFTAFFKHKDAINEIEATAYVTRYRLSLWNDFTFFLGDPVHGSELEQDDARVYAGANFAWHFHRRWRSISLRTTMGASARWDGVHVERWNAESQNGDFRQRLAPIDSDDVDQTNLAGYLEEDVVFNRFVRAIGGVRVDYFAFDVAGTDRGTKQKALVSPKATLVVSPLPDKLDLYLNFGMGFHSNQAQAALADGATRASPSGGTFVVQAVPRIYGGELGARVHLFNRVDAAAAFWVSYLENETVFDADTATFVPSAATRRLGFDLEVRARILRWLYADFDLAQADPVSLPNGAPSGGLALAPRLYLTGGLTAKHDFGERAGVVRGGLRFRYLGARPAFDENSAEYRQFAASDPSRVNTQSYFIVDLYGAYRWSFLEGSLAIQNLFDSTWREAEFGNHSCTHDETYNPASPHFAECGVSQPSRPGVADVHFTPGVPINLQFTLKAYF